MKLTKTTKEQLFQELTKIEEFSEKYKIHPSSRKNENYDLQMEFAYRDFLDIVRNPDKAKYAHFELSEEDIKEIQIRLVTIKVKYAQHSTFTEEEIENVVKAAEELCHNGRMPQSGGKIDKNDPEQYQRRNVGSKLNVLRTRLTPEQKKRLKDAKRSIDGSYGRYTEDELEDRVRRVEELCEQGINPTLNFPHDSEEYKLAAFVGNHKNQFSPEQVERIKAAKKSIKEHKKEYKPTPVTEQEILDAMKILDLCKSIKYDSAFQIHKDNEPLYQKYMLMRRKYENFCTTNKTLSGFEKTFSELMEKIDDTLVKNKKESVKKQFYDFLTEAPYYISCYIDSKMTAKEKRETLDRKNTLAALKRQFDLLDDTDRLYFDNRPTKEEYEAYKEIIEIMIKTECSQDEVHTFIIKSGIEKQYWAQKYLSEEKEVIENG